MNDAYDDMPERFAALAPAGRIAEPEEIAAAPNHTGRRQTRHTPPGVPWITGPVRRGAGGSEPGLR